MSEKQTITHPFGITVFGSAVVRVEPDVASLEFAVSRTAKQPKEAFRAARDAAKSVRSYLSARQIPDVSSSRVTLSQVTKWVDGENRLLGYAAKTKFHLVLKELDRLEELLIGIVEAGANEVSDVAMQTTRLKEIRAEARRRAVEAAREKAENYCKAAGVSLGGVVHIEDVNPEVLRGNYEGHTFHQAPTEDEGPIGAFDPGSISVSAAVLVAYEFT